MSGIVRAGIATSRALLTGVLEWIQ